VSVALCPAQMVVEFTLTVGAGFTVTVPDPVEGVAVSVALCPAQMVVEFTLTVGAGFTVTVPDPVEVQPDKV
jgi:hypothetical protein